MRRILRCAFSLTALIVVAVFLYTGCDTGGGNIVGYKITFDTDRDGDFEIYTMNDDGSNISRLTNSMEDDIYPSWSWDGSRIAFTSYRDTESIIDYLSVSI